MKSIDLLKAIACDVGDEAILRQICTMNTTRRASRLLLQFHTEFASTLAEAAVEDAYPCALWELACEAAIDAAKLRSPRSWSITTSDMRQGVLMAGVIADVCLAHRKGYRPILKKGPAHKINAFSERFGVRISSLADIED